MSAPVKATALPSYDEVTEGRPAYPSKQPQDPNPPEYNSAHPPGEAYPPTSGYTAPPPAQAPPPAGNNGSDAGDEGRAPGPFSGKDVRRKFIMKVYLTLTLQLAVIFGIVCLFFFVYPVGNYVRQTPGLYWASYGVFLVVYIVLACCGEFRRKTPHNYIALAIFTISLSYLMGTIAATSHGIGGQAVLITLAIIGGVTIAVTLFTIQTKYDFTSRCGFLFVFCWSLVLFGFIAIFTHNMILYTLYAWLAAAPFCLYLAYDTQLLVIGRYRKLSPEEYIFGALNLYLDILYLFLALFSMAVWFFERCMRV